MDTFKVGDRVEYNGMPATVISANGGWIGARLDNGYVACIDTRKERYCLNHVPCDVAPWNRYESFGVH